MAFAISANKDDFELPGIDNPRSFVRAPTTALKDITPPKTNTFSGNDPYQFSKLLGSLGAAIAPNTPMGRVGDVVSNMADTRIKRRQKLTDIEDTRQDARDIAERGYGNESKLFSMGVTADKDAAEYDYANKAKLFGMGVTADEDAANLLNQRKVTAQGTQNEFSLSKTAQNNDFILSKMAENTKRRLTQYGLSASTAAKAVEAQNTWLTKNQTAQNDLVRQQADQQYHRFLMADQRDKATGLVTKKGLTPEMALKQMAMERHAMNRYQKNPASFSGEITPPPGNVSTIKDFSPPGERTAPPLADINAADPSRQKKALGAAGGINSLAHLLNEQDQWLLRKPGVNMPSENSSSTEDMEQLIKNLP